MRKQKTKELVNTEWVERIAVNRLESALLSTGLVVPTIPTGDRLLESYVLLCLATRRRGT